MQLQVFWSNVKNSRHFTKGQSQVQVTGLIRLGALQSELTLLHSHLQVRPLSAKKGLIPQFSGSHPQVQVDGLIFLGSMHDGLLVSQMQLQVFGLTL